MNPRASRTADAAAGLTVGGLGVVLLLDALEAIHLSFGALAPMLLAAVGVILLSRGLAE